ncbi:MAG: GntR family transcriptional repressor for pyruvate dehydrogenase complex [Paracoccaceae bacterium]|jgi:GntR family transcriptional repressor for pyruvate dehydrogenase complex
MPFQKIHAERRLEPIVRQIEDLILRGVLRPGDRLPAERELSSQLGVSRPILRAAVANLEVRGLLTSRPGAGVFVADVLGSAFSPALIDLFASNEEAVFDYIAFRRDLESLAADRAARYGSDTDLAVVDAIFKKMELANTKSILGRGAAELDAEFHMSIIEASHNIVMLHMMRSMYQMLREGVFYNRQRMFKNRPTRDTLLDQHRDINEALQRRDPIDARAAVTAHLNYVEQDLVQQQRTKRRESVAKMRFEQEQLR